MLRIDNHSRLRWNDDVPKVRSAMYVCICNGVTDHQIREAADAGCSSVSGLTMRTGLGSSCGSCLPLAEAIMAELHATRALPLPVLARAA